MWVDGYSATQIADAIGGGISRNAVIGKAHRLGLGLTIDQVQAERAARAKPERSRARSKGSDTARAAPSLPDEPPPPDPRFMCMLDDLGPLRPDDPSKARCRGPIGEPGTEGFGYCGCYGAKMPGPYCDFHHRLYYQAGSATTDRKPVRGEGATSEPDADSDTVPVMDAA
jgi:GcrA cell cycle regulator